MLENLHKRKFSRAAGYLYLINSHLVFHPQTLDQVRFDGLTERDSLRICQTYLREFADDPAGYLRLMGYYYLKGRLDFMRRNWHDTCANAVKGFHFQPSSQVSIFDAAQGHALTSLADLELSQDVTQVLGLLSDLKTTQPAVALKPGVSDEENAEIRLIQTETGEPVGLDSVSMNGRLAGFEIPTQYYFRYGTKPDALSEKTPVRDMPAGRFGRVRDTGENLFRRISANAAALVFKKPEGLEAQSDMPIRFPKVAMCLEWPFGKDRNHLNGIGIIDLVFGWNTQAQKYGTLAGQKRAEGYPTLSYPGESIDLRDAVVSYTYRSESLDAKAFSPVAWIHGRTGTAFFPESYDDLTAWAVTDDSKPKSFVADGGWHRLEFDLPGQSTKWSFCGSNTEEMGKGMARYTYAPIQKIQRDNVGGNVCLAFVHGDDLDTPEGSIDLAQLEMSYRSRSLLGPGQEAVLLVPALNASGDVERLTDGSIGDIESCWISELNPDEPIDLIWRLRDGADIESFKLYQCVLAPAKGLEIALSTDGQAFQDVWHGDLDDTPESPAEWGVSGGNDEICVVGLASPVRAQYVRLRVKSAYRQGIAGLDAFEVFGQGLPFIPSPGEFTFSENIEDLEVGTPFFAQLVAENTDGVFEGDVVEICRPDRDVPYILSGSVIERCDDMARIALRTIAMGSMATLRVVLTSGQGEEISAPPISIGKWTAARDVRVNVGGLKPAVAYQVVCRAENENGTSEAFTFQCDAHG